MCRLVMCRLYKSRLVKSRFPEDEETIVWQCLINEQIYKGRYKGSLCKANIKAVCARVVYTKIFRTSTIYAWAVCAWVVCVKAVWKTVDGEKYSKQLILRSIK